jgi:excisionase family DNA binding protein
MATDDSNVTYAKDKPITIKDLSGYLKVHASTVYRQLKLGQIPASKVGNGWRFDADSIDRWRLEQDNLLLWGGG